MLRRSPLRRLTALRPVRLRVTAADLRQANVKRKSSYRERPRDLAYMAWIRRQPCAVRALPPDPNRLTPCSGPVEADHLGARGVGRKADDRTCAPLCRQHHRERTDHAGAFRDLSQAEHRIWRANVLELVALSALQAARIGALA